MITGINESKTLTNVNLMEENVTKINGGITINVDVSVKKKDYIWNQFRKNLASIMDDSTIMCDEVIESFDEEQFLMKIKHYVKCEISIFYLQFY